MVEPQEKVASTSGSGKGQWTFASTRFELPLLALCGLIAGLSSPGFNYWLLAWVAWIFPMIWTLRQNTLMRVFWGGFWMGLAYGGLYCSWFFDLHPLSWMGFGDFESRVVTLAGWLLLAAENGLLMGGLLLLFRWLPNAWLRLLLFPLLWVGGFALMNMTPLALPWTLIEYSQVQVPSMRLVMAWISGSGLSALIAAHNVLWAAGLKASGYGFLNFQSSHSSAKSAGNSFAVLKAVSPLILPFICPLLLAGGYGLFSSPSGQAWPMPVAVVQANLPIETVRSGLLSVDKVEVTYLRPVEKAPLPQNTLILYPEEGVVPGWVHTRLPETNLTFRRLLKLAKTKQSYIAVGVSLLNDVPSSQPTRGQLLRYNALALISPDTKVSFYRKRRLVPFGEFTPYGWGKGLTNLLSAFNIAYSADFEPGSLQPALLNAGNVRLGPLICFELIDALPMGQGFGWAYQKLGTDLLVNASNLGWFHQNPLLEAQFLAIGQVRAAETRLPLIIAGNTGPSAIIGPQGQVLLRTSPATFFQHKTRILFYNGKQRQVFSSSWKP